MQLNLVHVPSLNVVLEVVTTCKHFYYNTATTSKYLNTATIVPVILNQACVKHHAVPDPGAPGLTRSSRDFRSGGPGSINILIDPNDP